MNNERFRLCNSPLAGFTHSLIGVYIIPVQSALSGTLEAVCVSRWDKDSPGTKLAHSPTEVCVFCLLGLISCMCAVCVYLRCHVFHCFKIAFQNQNPGGFWPDGDAV